MVVTDPSFVPDYAELGGGVRNPIHSTSLRSSGRRAAVAAQPSFMILTVLLIHAGRYDEAAYRKRLETPTPLTPRGNFGSDRSIELESCMKSIM
jgi:hypothetical protein